MTRITIFIVLFAIFACSTLAYAQYNITGTSQIHFSTSNITLLSGQSASVTYIVSLANGATGTTNVNMIVKSAGVTSEGVGSQLSKTSGSPTFAGILTVSTTSAAIPGTYYIILNTTGADPSISNATLSLQLEANSSIYSNITSTSTIIPDSFGIYNSSTVDINATNGGNVSVNGPGGVVITTVIKPGTCVQIANMINCSSYNFTVLVLNLTNSTLGPPSNNSTPVFGLLFEIDGQINPLISLVDKNGKSDPVTTIITNNAGASGSWTYLGYELNSTKYALGAYGQENNWTQGSNSIINNQFYNSTLIVVTKSNSKQPSTTIVQHKQSTTIAPPPISINGLSIDEFYLIVGLIIALIVGLIIAALVTKKK